jgi:Domain of unknown function (DUF4145)
MDIVADYHLSTNPEPSDPEEEYNYELLLCPACKEVTLWKHFEHYLLDVEDIKTETLYPQGLKTSSFPSAIQKAYEAALKARTIDANAYAILLGRMLEVVCEDRKVEGENLYEKLKILAEKGEIPVNLVGVAHGLRMFRNIGVHETLKGLTSDEVPILNDLSKAILEYIYIAPSLARQAEDRLKRLKKKKSRSENIGEDPSF